MTYHFSIPIAPKGQKRDRIATIGGHARSYTDTAQKHYAAKIRALLAGNAPAAPLHGAIKIEINCMLPIPQSWSKKKKESALDWELRPMVKPDIDNLVKQVLDCMNGIVWEDDKQVVELEVYKWYSDLPCWDITVETIPNSAAPHTCKEIF